MKLYPVNLLPLISTAIGILSFVLAVIIMSSVVFDTISEWYLAALNPCFNPLNKQKSSLKNICEFLPWNGSGAFIISAPKYLQIHCIPRHTPSIGHLSL